MTAEEVLASYLDEELPDFIGMPELTVNQRGRFDNYPLNIAASRGRPEEVAALLAGGADVNAVGELGNQALHDAIGAGNVQIVRMLLDAGARLDAINEFGQSPIDMAQVSSDPEIKRLVLSALPGGSSPP